MYAKYAVGYMTPLKETPMVVSRPGLHLRISPMIGCARYVA